MGFISCGMQCRGQHCGTHCKPGSEAAVEQLSQQVMIASSTIPLELCDENSTPSDSQEPQNVQEILCEETVSLEKNSSLRSSRMARCGLFESLPHPSWRTSSRRAYTTRRRASRASSARRSNPLKGPRSSRGDGSPRLTVPLTSRVTSPLKRGVSTMTQHDLGSYGPS